MKFVNISACHLALPSVSSLTPTGRFFIAGRSWICFIATLLTIGLPLTSPRSAPIVI